MVCIGAGDLTPDRAGQCAQNGSGAAGRVIYVNPDNPKCDKSQGFLFSTPVCTLDQAVDQAVLMGGRRFIRIAGTLDPLQKYNVLSDGQPYSFIGAPMGTSMTQATVRGRGLLFGITGGGSLTLDQLILQQINPDNMVVECSGTLGVKTPTLNMRNTIVLGSTPPNTAMVSSSAVYISNCNTVLEGNVIGVRTVANLSDGTGAHGKALYLSDSSAGGNETTILIENNIIAGNAGLAMDLASNNQATSKFVMRFNTIISNGRGSPNSFAIFCPSPGLSKIQFTHSIVTQNSTQNGSQFDRYTGCNAKDIVVGNTEMGNADLIALPFSPDPTFRMQNNAMNQACCIDKVTPTGSETLPTIDIDGHSRPQNGKWDIGASELLQ
jgi:hypothetical protein